MKRILWLILLLPLCLVSLSAQIASYYQFSSTTGTYESIEGEEHPETVSHHISELIDVGFSFGYGLNTYSRLRISSYGCVVMAERIGAFFINNLQTNESPILAPLWDEMTLELPARTLLSGTAPNRVFTVQYSGVRWNYNDDNSFEYQVKLYENGNVKFCYGPSSGTPGGSASIGISMKPYGSGNFFSITPGETATYSTTVENSTINTYPGEGTIYNFTIAANNVRDLAALCVTGNQTPVQGVPTDYHVFVRNMGQNPQSGYTVKLMNGTVVLASVAGNTILPGLVQEYILSWTPVSTGVLFISAKVEIQNDQVPANNISPNLKTHTLPENANEILIGAGNQLSNQPICMSYQHNLYEIIYPHSEINAYGMINGVGFFNSFQHNRNAITVTVWLGAIDDENLSSGWLPSSQLTQVYVGLVDFLAGENCTYIPFSLPFNYCWGNLCLIIHAASNSNTGYEFFRCQALGSPRARQRYSTGALNPDNPGSTGLSEFYPKTMFCFTPVTGNAAFGVYPGQKNWGTVLMNSAHDETFNLSNSGTGSITIESIGLEGSPMMSLLDLPTLPVTITYGQSVAFRALYLPTAAGSYAAEVSITDNLGRTLHTVALAGACVDETIYTLPHTESFDNTGPPNLPVGWQVYNVSTNSYIRSVADGNYHSPQVSVEFDCYNHDNLLLMAPHLSSAMQTNTKRVRFWAKGNSTNAAMQVGIISDTGDPGTFAVIKSVALSQGWTEYLVGLHPYGGTGSTIAFRLNNAYDEAYLDDVTIEDIPPNDISAVSIAGNNLPALDSASLYTVTVSNPGLLAQSNYLVKLFTQDNVEIASASGPPVQPGLEANSLLSWTPDTLNVTSVYARIFLTGDTDPANDQSVAFQITVQPAGTSTVTIGTGVHRSSNPLVLSERSSLFETIYRSDEINLTGDITAVSFYSNFAQTVPDKHIKIWLGTTLQTTLSTGWIPATQLTPVFDGNVNLQAGTGTLTIPLQTPFPYDAQSNLVIMVSMPLDTQGYGNMYFYNQYDFPVRSRIVYSQDTEYNPDQPPEGREESYYPKASIHFLPTNPLPLFNIIPLTHDYGNVLLNASSARNFTIYNQGNGTLTFENIAISDPQFSVSNLTNLPFVLNPGQYCTFAVLFQPTTAGVHTAVMTVTDNLERVQHTISLSGTGIDNTINSLPYYQDFDNVTNNSLPLDWSKIEQSNSGRIYLSSHPCYSEPNCVFFHTMADPDANLILIAPALSGSVPVNAVRVKFRAHSSSYRNMSVGILSNASDANTYTEVQSISLPSLLWVQYTVSFQNFTGAGHHIGFKIPPGISHNLWIDDVVIEEIPQNGLEATTITGTGTPKTGEASIYQVGLFNWSNSPQTVYTVKLYSQDNIELASVPGPAINPQATAIADISWTPINTATTSIYAKVFLEGDTYGADDQSPPLAVFVQPENTTVRIVGDGTELAQLPAIMMRSSSLYETIYQSDELNFTGMVNSLVLYSSFLNSYPDSYAHIWLGNTLQTDLTSGWIPSGEMTEVFNGTINLPHDENTILIPLDTPFPYIGDNLVMMYYTHSPANVFNGGDYFKCQSVGTNRSRYIADYVSGYDPADPPATGDSLSGQFPMTGFCYNALGTGQLTGVVRNILNQNPVPNASVLAANCTAITDENGLYTMQVPVGIYQAICTAADYDTLTLNLTVIENQQTTLDFSLNPVTSNPDDLYIIATALLPNYPNPFNPETTISYDIKETVPVNITVYNLKGQQVCTLVREIKARGHHSVVWKGKDAKGQDVSSGIYLYRMKAGKQVITKKMMLLK